MLKELTMAELVQRIHINEVTEVSVTCALCKSSVVLPLEKCRRGSLNCPGCGHDLHMTSPMENPLGGLAVALMKLQEISQREGAPKIEFILKAPVGPR